MDDAGPEAMVRQNLLDRLLNSVKQVQVYFGARQEIATETDARVSALCVEWEMVLAHAAKKQKPKNSLRLTGRSEGVSLWPLAKLCVSAEDLVRFSRLTHVTSELGRGRAWLRAAINERTLENYMHTVLAQEEQLRKLYEPSAFLLDQERSTMLPIMAAGLSSIIFAITTDASYLNTPARSVQLPAPVAPPSPPPSDRTEPRPLLPEASQLPPPATAGVGKLRDPPHERPSYSFPPPITHTSQGHGALPLLDQEADSDMIAVSTKVKKKKKNKSAKSKSGNMYGGSTRPPLHMSSPEQDMPSGLSPRAEADKIVPLRESASSSSSRLSLDSMTEDGSAPPMYVALTTPSSQLVLSGEAMAAANATALVLSASTTSMPAPSNSPPPSPQPNTEDQQLADTAQTDSSPQSPSRSSSPNDEMKSAMLALSKMKDDLELQNRTLADRVAELQQEVHRLQEELDWSKKELASAREVQSSNKVALERENDLLREQLKKYISIVQSQRKESSSASESEVLTQSGGTAPQEQLTAGDGNLAEKLPEKPHSAVDKKLQDMAEMYADLMELNERLHRTVVDKDGTICALVRSLKEACIEIPLPEDQLPAAATTEEKISLVEVWIPSVIRKGRGPDGFHVYQVFVSIKGVEWNVYRRYTEFREFHRQLQKHLPEVAAFHFPPKKAIKNKTSQFVEERRQRLQDYLRFVIKCCSGCSGKTSTSKTGSKNKAEPLLTHNTTKETLVTIFPFFKEDFNQDPNPAPQPPSYSGL